MNAWEILGIEPTQNKRAIKKAYAKLIAQFHPEDHPEKFREIQSAYDYVMGEVNKREHSYETDTSSLTQGFKNDRIIGEKESELNATSPEEQNVQYDNNRMYDEFKLDLLFPNHQDQPEDMNTAVYEDAPIQKEKLEIENEINMEDILYNRISERLNYVTDEDSLRILLSNQTFFDLMGNIPFYQKVCKLIQSHFNKFDLVAASYLLDVFRSIEVAYDYQADEYAITKFMDDKNNQASKSAKRRRYLNRTAVLTLLPLLYLLTLTGINKEKKEDKIESDTINEVIRDTQVNIKVQELKNKELLEAYLLEERNEKLSCLDASTSYLCSIPNEKAYIVEVELERGVFVGVKSIKEFNVTDKKPAQ